MTINIDTSNFQDLKDYFDKILNLDKSTYKSSNDEPTPIDCIIEMIAKIPEELWKRKDLQILDPCCGNGNFSIPVIFKLLEMNPSYKIKHILENILEFNDINRERLQNVEKVFCGDKYSLKITSDDFINGSKTDKKDKKDKKYDLIMANPPFAKLLENGERASKNHNLIQDFLKSALERLKPRGYLLFITPDSWLSYADRNTLVSIITSMQIIHLDIHTAKKYFKRVGSSFTWYIVQYTPFHKPIDITGIWKGFKYSSQVSSGTRRYIPLLYNSIVQSILSKTIDCPLFTNNKFQVETSSDLHRYTKRDIISNDKTPEYCYRLIHTPKQTVYANRPHKYQDGYKVFISTTDRYKVYIDNCGMTQSIVFIRCRDFEQAEQFRQILEHPLYIFINNICRWGNFNNIRILQRFPLPLLEKENMCENLYENIYLYFDITTEEIQYIEDNL